MSGTLYNFCYDKLRFVTSCDNERGGRQAWPCVCFFAQQTNWSKFKIHCPTLSRLLKTDLKPEDFSLCKIYQVNNYSHCCLNPLTWVLSWGLWDQTLCTKDGLFDLTIQEYLVQAKLPLSNTSCVGGKHTRQTEKDLIIRRAKSERKMLDSSSCAEFCITCVLLFLSTLTLAAVNGRRNRERCLAVLICLVYAPPLQVLQNVKVNNIIVPYWVSLTDLLCFSSRFHLTKRDESLRFIVHGVFCLIFPLPPWKLRFPVASLSNSVVINFILLWASLVKNGISSPKPKPRASCVMPSNRGPRRILSRVFEREPLAPG